jgi:hypothetical protein
MNGICGVTPDNTNSHSALIKNIKNIKYKDLFCEEPAHVILNTSHNDHNTLNALSEAHSSLGITQVVKPLTRFLCSVVGMGFAIRDNKILLTSNVNIVCIAIRIPQ